MCGLSFDLLMDLRTLIILIAVTVAFALILKEIAIPLSKVQASLVGLVAKEA
jgi:hypothetical protein